jgi:hypothetical protein
VNQGILTQIQQPPAMPYELLGRPTPVPLPGLESGYDIDAADYIRRVEAADGQALGLPVRLAIDAFVRGCKADGIWNAIKASCILAGARTLSGALVPLVGTAPTNFNFVAGDYNRKTGLVGDGSTKYLNSNRNNNTDPQDNQHIAAYASLASTSASARYPTYIGAGGAATGTTAIARNESNGQLFSRNRSSSFDLAGGGGDTGLIAVNRSTSSAFIFRRSKASTSYTRTSQVPFNGLLFIFNINVSGSPASDSYSSARLAFYSIGESLDLALLDARVTTLINAFATAIP